MTRYAIFIALLVAGGCYFDGSGLEPRCGNGTAERGEECDGTDLGGATCSSLGYAGGVLGCTSLCTFDTSGCSGAGPSCGNGVRDAGEECDGADLGGKGCADLGYSEGVLRCTSLCTFDTSGCSGGTVPENCGNGVLDPGEECDGTSFRDPLMSSGSCEDLGYHGGRIGCTSHCRVDLSDCEAHGRCGDGRIQPEHEECDGSDLGPITSCRDASPLFYDVPSVRCTQSCTLDTSACPYCGDGTVQPDLGEACDVGAGPHEFGDFHGRCAPDCSVLVLFDEVEDPDGSKQQVNGVAVAPSGDSFAVVGVTEGRFLDRPTAVNREAFILFYDSSGARGYRAVYHSETFPSEANDVLLDGQDAIVVGYRTYNDMGDLDGVAWRISPTNDVFKESVWGDSQAEVGMRVALGGGTLYVISREETTRGTVRTFVPTLEYGDPVYVEDAIRRDLDQQMDTYSLGRTWIEALLVTQDAVYVGGSVKVTPGADPTAISYQGFVIKYDLSLNMVVWSRVFGLMAGDAFGGGAHERVRALVTDGAGIYAVGEYNCYGGHGYFSSCRGGQEVFVMKVDPDGTLHPQDALVLGGPGQDIVTDAVVDGGNIYVVGGTDSSPFEGRAGHGLLDGYVCSISLVPLAVDRCLVLGTSANDKFKSVDLITLNGMPTLVVGGFSEGALEPGFAKSDSSRDALTVLVMGAGR